MLMCLSQPAGLQVTHVAAWRWLDTGLPAAGIGPDGGDPARTIGQGTD